MVFIADDTLRQQPIGAGHMTVLQLHGPMGSCVLPWWLFIAGDTLCHQPMRTGHMTVLQLHGPMAFRVLQWCHPMLASIQGGQAVVPGTLPCMVCGSGFRPAHSQFQHRFYIVTMLKEESFTYMCNVFAGSLDSSN